jgi:alkanesulfonate monooxygenase SsuD/methylene tetrahydromethanopterin reductase-like flavin-dependent oxidoreductase (luciferase family)
MAKLGLGLPDYIWNVDVHGSIELAGVAENAGFDSLWKGETTSVNGPMTLSAVASETSDVTLGTGITNVYSRSPALLGMTAATLDRLSGGRAALGLGVSSPPIVEGWHGEPFDRPLRRTRETIEIVRQVTEGGRLEYEGEIFDVGPYTVGLSAAEDVPIFNAAMGEVNRQLTGEFADGWLPILVPLSRMAEFVDDIESAAHEAGRDRPTMAPWIVFSPDDDPEYARRQAKLMIAQEMGMGYNELVRQFGFGDPGDAANRAFRDGDREAAAAEITDEMLDEFAIYGTPEACLAELETVVDEGVDHPVIWLPFSLSYDELDAAIRTIGSSFSG